MSDPKIEDTFQPAQENEPVNLKQEAEDESSGGPQEGTAEKGETDDHEQSSTEKEFTEEEDSIETLREKVTEAEQKADEAYQKMLRAQADFENYRRRTRKEKEEQLKYAALPLIEQLLPALDNFERALNASEMNSENDSLVKGIQMVFEQIEQVLGEQGVEVIPSVGEPFDPHVHQAVMQVESEEHESGIVVEQLQKGYQLKDRVIRPAMVKVSS